jgi:aryl-alcohol dehydrogenase-like predicted oxidoreductase
VRYRRLGSAGVKVSEIALGSWRTYGGSVGEKQARACVRRAFELGVNFFDTANVYAGGEAEEIVGRALAAYERDDYVLATKVFFAMGDGPNDRGLSRKHVFEQCERSLKRLGVDYVDLYQCHRPDPETPVEETLRALDDLVTQGKVLYVGVSEWSAEQLDEARTIQRELGFDPIVSNQPQYSLLWRGIEDAVLPLSKQLGIGQIVWSPLAQGVLTGKYKPGEQPPEGSRATNPQDRGFIEWLLRDEVLAAVAALEPIARELGITTAQLALAWTLRDPGVASAIVGASRPEQVDENVAASGVELGADVLARIDTALAPALQALQSPS